MRKYLLFGTTGVFLVFVGALLSVGVWTMVYAHGGDPNLIHSCVNNKSGEIKIIDASETCSKNWSPLDWNKQAPPKALALYTRVSNVVNIFPEAVGEAVASCDAGDVATGGGYEGDHGSFGGGFRVAIFGNRPAPSGDAWVVRARNESGNFLNLTAYVVCADVTP
jgi:hypothetical protein